MKSQQSQCHMTCVISKETKPIFWAGPFYPKLGIETDKTSSLIGSPLKLWIDRVSAIYDVTHWSAISSLEREQMTLQHASIHL